MAPPPAQRGGDDSTLLHIERISQYVSLSPSSLSFPLPAISASILSPLLLSYFPAARGIVLAYEDVELSSSPPGNTTKASREKQGEGELLLRHVDENIAPYLWVTASFLVLRPVAGKWIKGVVTHQSKTHITLSHLNTFPVSVTKEHLPVGWTWHTEQQGMVKKGWDGRLSDEGGWWVDQDGEKVQGEVEVRIRDFDGRMDGRGRGTGFLRVEGSLVTIEEEKSRREKVGGKQRANGVLKARRSGGEVIEAE